MNYTFISASGLILRYIFIAKLLLEIYQKHNKHSSSQNKISNIYIISHFYTTFTCVHHSIAFSLWIKRFEMEAQAATGCSHIDGFKPLVSYEGHDSFSWPWTNPSLNILLRLIA